jgi:hypothetical protein
VKRRDPEADFEKHAAECPTCKASTQRKELCEKGKSLYGKARKAYLR